MYGAFRTAPMDSAASLDCVRHVVETTPGIASVEYSEDRPRKAIFHPTPWVYTHFYRGTPESRIVGALQVYKEYDGRLSYKNMLFYINRVPPQEEIDATRPVMRVMEIELAQQCGMTDLPANIEESCNGVVCPPLG